MTQPRIPEATELLQLLATVPHHRKAHTQLCRYWVYRGLRDSGPRPDCTCHVDKIRKLLGKPASNAPEGEKAG